MKTSTGLQLVIACSVGLLSTGIAFSQSAPPPPNASRIDQDIRREPAPLNRTLTLDQPRYPDQIPEGARAAQLTLRDVEIQGNRTLSTQELMPIWSTKVGKTISLAEAFQIAAEITARYRDAGYILSQAIVPKQDLQVEGASLKIEVIEGYVARVTINDTPQMQSELQPYADKITRDKPTQLRDLERTLLLLNELPGLSARASLKQSTAFGASDLDLSLAHDPAVFSLSSHNRTSEALGSVRVEALADFRSALTSFDRHSIRVISSLDDRLAYGGYTGEVPVGSDGLRLNWNVSASRAEPEIDIPLNIDSKSTHFGLGIAYPIVRSRATNLDVRLGVDGSNNSSSEPFDTEDNIRAVRAGITWDLADRIGGMTILDVEVSQGLTGAGASSKDDPRLSRNGLGRPDFTKETVYLARLQSLGGPFSLLLAATGQYSEDVLVTAEEFGLGGDLFLRAYDPSELVGDYGYAGKAELRSNLTMGGFNATLYLYQDAGKVLYRTADTPSQSILSSGLGIRFSTAWGVRGYLEVAKPRHKIAVSTGDEDARVFGGLGFDF